MFNLIKKSDEEGPDGKFKLVFKNKEGRGRFEQRKIEHGKG